MLPNYDVDMIARCLPHVFDDDHAWGYQIAEARRDPAMPAPDVDPSMSFTAFAVAADIQKAFARLPSDCRYAIQCRIMEDLTWANTAKRCGRARNTVQELVADGLQEMVEFLQPWDYPPITEDDPACQSETPQADTQQVG